MAPKLKLTYFDGRGRAEISRLVLAAAKRKFEDNRIGFEDWPALKAGNCSNTIIICEPNLGHIDPKWNKSGTF